MAFSHYVALLAQIRGDVSHASIGQQQVARVSGHIHQVDVLQPAPVRKTAVRPRRMQQLVGNGSDLSSAGPLRPFGQRHGLGCRCFTVRHVDQAKGRDVDAAASAVFRILSSGQPGLGVINRHVPLHKPSRSAVGVARMGDRSGHWSRRRSALPTRAQPLVTADLDFGQFDPWPPDLLVGART